MKIVFNIIRYYKRFEFWMDDIQCIKNFPLFQQIKFGLSWCVHDMLDCTYYFCVWRRARHCNVYVYMHADMIFIFISTDLQDDFLNVVRLWVILEQGWWTWCMHTIPVSLQFLNVFRDFDSTVKIKYDWKSFDVISFFKH